MFEVQSGFSTKSLLMKSGGTSVGCLLAWEYEDIKYEALFLEIASASIFSRAGI